MATIRRASADDVSALLPLVSQYWQFESIAGFAPDVVAAQLHRLLTEPRLGSGWLATADGAAIGYLLAVYVFSLEHLGITAEIDEFFVVPARRGSGAGRELLQAAETEFARTGCGNVSLQLAHDNQDAREFYLRRGYSARSRFGLLEKTLARR